MNDGAIQSGLDQLRQRISAGAESPMAAQMGLRLVSVADGQAVFEAIPTAQFYNPQNRIHGGYTATLIDSALGCAVQTKLASGVGFGTVELSVNYVGKITDETSPLICTGNVIHAGRTMYTAEAKVVDRAGKLYAHGTGTFLVYPT
jgi:uncharacterized protein (TIGR00369 family)